MKVFLSSKNSLDKRFTIKSAFRACCDAFMEVSVVLLKLLEKKSVDVSISVGKNVSYPKLLRSIKVNVYPRRELYTF